MEQGNVGGVLAHAIVIGHRGKEREADHRAVGTPQQSGILLATCYLRL